MKSRLPSQPVLKSFAVQMDAVHYNNVFIALRRMGAPIKLMLPGMRGFEVLLDAEAWVCYDRSLNNQPLLAWTSFRGNARSGLYDAVPCQLLFYHPYAALLMRSLPEDINRMLLKRLSRPVPVPAAQVVALR